MKTCLLLFVCCASMTAAASLADETQLRDVLDAWEQGCNAIWSYDLYVSAEGEWYDDKGAVSVRMNAPSRQVYKRAKRRLETLPEGGGGGAPVQVQIWDGELAKAYVAMAHHLNIFTQLRSTAPGLPAADYETSYRDAEHHTPYLETIRGRVGTKLSYEDGKFVVYTPPAQGKMYSPYGLRVWLDEQKNFLPVRSEALRDNFGSEYVAYETEVTLAEVAPGVWAPVKWVFINFPLTLPKPEAGPRRRTGMSTFIVDMDVSRFNFDVPDSEFTIDVPAGTEVFDEIQDVSYTYGEPNNPAAHLSELVLSGRAAAKELQGRRLSKSPDIEGHSYRLYALLGANALVAVAVACFIVWRARRAQTNSNH